ncbi:MAG: ABC transporter ATP-binding protein [Nitrosospira sp.]|nr:ABC transporter ATP-binding protein [Nitrosospira sp.]
MNLLEVRGLKVSYGGINAVKGIDLEIREGELVALIGANGAGKSTTLRALAGLERPAGGTIHYQGHSISHQPTHQLVRKGLVLVPEGRGIFGRLTVEENLHMGAYCRDDTAEIAADMQRVYARFPRLQERSHQAAGTLSGGEQQMLAIGRALMSRPRLLLLDEPSMGLAPLMVQKIFETIRAIAAEGVTILLVEQNAKLALETSHRGYVLESGLITLHDEAKALLSNEKVRHAYLGE